MKARFISSINQIDKQKWNALVSQNYPFAKYEFLSALEESGSVGGNSGWTPNHLLIEDDTNNEQSLIFAMPVYEKEHSYGEYVFDWQWASAFERYGRQYYPKLLTAIPFTPATGPRMLAAPEVDMSELWKIIRSALDINTSGSSYSSWHILFVNEQTKQILANDPEILAREDVQFHWKNHNTDGKPYRDFDHFLKGFRSTKRKQIRRERRKIEEQNLKVVRRTGADITEQHWQEFYACYKATYLKRSGHTGYLTQAFFEQVAKTMANQCMLVSAYEAGNNPAGESEQNDEVLIACSLFFFDDERLYGRYWGALANYDCLHFEACYYQGIEFAIERGLIRFDPGTQGEHKLVRGFEPTKTYSFHWVGDADFANAIDEFLQRERQHTQAYQDSAAQYLPFRKDQQREEPKK